jgi:hypothetical protein
MSRTKTLRRSLAGLLGLTLLVGCTDPEAERAALELAVAEADARVVAAQLAISRYDGTAEIEEIVAEKEADERAVAAGDLPAAEAELRAASREARLARILAAQEDLDIAQDSTWLRMAGALESARALQREAREALELFLVEQQEP